MLSTATSSTGSGPAAPLPLDEGKRLPALDGLRGLAVLLVLLDHASDAELRIFPSADMNRAGKYGVYLFFVLSAFLLTHLLLLRPAAELTRARTWLNYAVRRFLRIFPLYAVVLAILVLVHKLEWLKWHEYFNHLLLRDGQKQFWTIPVEVKYYMILPLFALTLSWLRDRAWLRAALAGVGALAVLGGVLYLEPIWAVAPKPGRGHAIFLAQVLEPFLIGTVAALVHQAMARRPVGTARFAPWLEVAAFGALAAAFLRIPSIYNALFSPEEYLKKLPLDSLMCGLLWSLVLLGMLHGKGYLRRLFELAPIRYLGLVSYSAYLWHLKFLTDVDDMKVPPPLRLVIFIAVVVAVSSVSYFLIERPLSRLRFTRSGLRAAEPTLPASTLDPVISRRTSASEVA